MISSRTELRDFLLGSDAAMATGALEVELLFSVDSKTHNNVHHIIQYAVNEM